MAEGGGEVVSVLSGSRQRGGVTTVRSTGAGPRVVIEGCLFIRKFECHLGRPHLPKHPSVILQGCHAYVFVGNYF